MQNVITFACIYDDSDTFDAVDGWSNCIQNKAIQCIATDNLSAHLDNVVTGSCHNSKRRSTALATALFAMGIFQLNCVTALTCFENNLFHRAVADFTAATSTRNRSRI